MSHNSFGHLFRFTSWGESHGAAIGCVVDGVPPRIRLSEEDIQKDLDRRRPGGSRFVSQRREEDQSADSLRAHGGEEGRVFNDGCAPFHDD